MGQYNLYGDEEVTDLDGEVLTEKTAARKWGIAFTPTILFLPEGADGSLDARQAAVASMPGAFQKGTFLDMFTWVRDKLYETDEDFQRYHARRIRERTEAGVPNTDRSEEHTSELQSLMRISYAVFCLHKKKLYSKEQHEEDCTIE